MADAQEIYRLFSATPLRLRKKAARSPSASPSVDADAAPDVTRATTTPSRAIASNTTPLLLSPSAFVTPRKSIATLADVERLEGRIESACRVNDGGGDAFQTPPPAHKRLVTETEEMGETQRQPQPQPQTQPQRRTTRSSKAAIAPLSTETAQAAAVVVPRKQKRVTRSVAVVNSNTGGEYVDTPTKATAPPKRSRKSVRQEPRRLQLQDRHSALGVDVRDSKVRGVEMGDINEEDVAMEPASISRNMMDVFADIDEAVLDPAAMEQPKSARKKATPHRINMKEAYAYLTESVMKKSAFEASEKKAHSSVKTADKENSSIEPISISRNIMDDFDDIDDVLTDPVVVEKPKNTKKKVTSRRQTVPHQTKSKKTSTSSDDSTLDTFAVDTAGNVLRPNEAEKENFLKDPVSMSRNILSEFADTAGVVSDPAVAKKPVSIKTRATTRRQPAPRRSKLNKSSTHSTESVMESQAFEASDGVDPSKALDIDIGDVTMETGSISRNIMDDYSDSEGSLLDPPVKEKPLKTKKKAAPRQPKKKLVPALPGDTVMEDSATQSTGADDQSNLNEICEANATIEAKSIETDRIDDVTDVGKSLPHPVTVEHKATKRGKAASRRQPVPRRSRLKKAPETTESVEENRVPNPPDERNHLNVEKTEGGTAIESIPISRNIMGDFAEVDDVPPDPVVVVAKPKSTRKKVALRQTKTKTTSAAQEPVRRSRRLHDKAETALQVEELKIIERSSDVANEEIVGSSVVEEPTLAAQVETMDEPMLRESVEPVEATPAPPALPALPVIDVVDVFCKPLLEMGTTSGRLFALWFNALGREVEVCADDEAATLVEILHDFFGVCGGISRTEANTRARVEGEDKPDEDVTMVDLATKTKRKAVRFRHFDLSSLNLRYNEDRSVAGFVDGLVLEYVGIVDHIAKLWGRRDSPAHASMVAHIVGVLSDTDRLAERTKGDNLVSSAFRSMTESEHDEVRASQPFFSDEFAKLSVEASTQPTFMELVFSSLIQSLVRFRLRELFLPYDPKALLDDGDRLQIANYEHQDFGAAVHRALKEVYLFGGLATPLLGVLESHPDPRSESVKNAVHALDIDDLVHVEQFMLACRYLRLSFSSCVLLDRDEDEETAQLCEGLEKLCALVKRLGFEDEAHLFPLASIGEFVRELERREPLFITLEKVLEIVGLPHYDAEAPCVECNEIVTRAQQAEAISCSSCSGRFHLGCLGLPLSFAQFAGNYTCPICYLGRSR